MWPNDVKGCCDEREHKAEANFVANVELKRRKKISIEVWPNLSFKNSDQVVEGGEKFAKPASVVKLQ
jgi:hypothetical protein